MIRETVQIAREVEAPLSRRCRSSWADGTLAAAGSDAGGRICRCRGRRARARRRCSTWCAAWRPANRSKGIPGVGYKEDGRIVLQPRAPAAAIARNAAEGLSPGRFRRLSARLRTALGDVHLQPRLPLQLRLLHQRRRLRPQVERARAGPGGGGDHRPGEPLQPGTAVDRRRQFPGGPRARRRHRRRDWCGAASSSTGAFRRPPTW